MPDSARSFGLDLAAVSVVEYHGKGLTTSAKITIHLTAPCPLERRSEAFLRVRQVFPPHVPDSVLLSSLDGKGNKCAPCSAPRR